MLDYSSAHWGAYLAAVFLIEITPGPDMAFILAHAASGGRRAGMAATVGVWIGALGHVSLAALGLSAIVAASATAFALVKWVGVAYLIWLGVRALRSRGGSAATVATEGAASFRRVAARGALVDLLNPKVAMFFLAFLPQFVEPGAGPVWLQLMVHGLLIVVGAAIVEIPLVLLGDRLTRAVRARRGLAVWLDRAMGTMFIALGLRLAAMGSR